jgi:hypothetical protein
VFQQGTIDIIGQINEFVSSRRSVYDHVELQRSLTERASQMSRLERQGLSFTSQISRVTLTAAFIVELKPGARSYSVIYISHSEPMGSAQYKPFLGLSGLSYDGVEKSIPLFGVWISLTDYIVLGETPIYSLYHLV